MLEEVRRHLTQSLQRIKERQQERVKGGAFSEPG